MTTFETLKIIDFDFLEFAVQDLDRAAELYFKLGFEKVATREIRERKLTSYLMQRNHISVLVSRSENPGDFIYQFLQTHGEGLANIAFRCEDAVSALEIAMNRGAQIVEPPKAYQKDFGAIQQAAIQTFSDVRHTFISRKGNLFLEGFEVAVKSHEKADGLQRIDHFSFAVEKTQKDLWENFYEKVFGLTTFRSMNFFTTRRKLQSSILKSPNGMIKIAIVSPTEAGSSAQDFLDIHHGAGVQHVAMESSELVKFLKSARASGLPFQEIPNSYYESLSTRQPTIPESIAELKELGILADAEPGGYLLQSFTRHVMGPFFYEFLQRNGCEGFGEGNDRDLP